MKESSRTAGQRKIVTLTATVAGLGVAGAVGLAVVAANGTAQAASTATNTTAGTTSGCRRPPARRRARRSAAPASKGTAPVVQHGNLVS